MKSKLSLRQIESELNGRSRQANVKMPFWLIGKNDDQGISYCRDCILKQNPHAKPGEDYDGGWTQEEDGVETCETCGCLLDYTLTDYGVDEELSHFEEDSWDWNDPDACYELNAILGGIVRDDKSLMRRFMKIVRKGNNRPQLELAREVR